MLTIALGLGLATAVLAGGRLSRLLELQVRAKWTIAAAFAIQVVVLALFPHGAHALHVAGHIGSYLLAAAFVWANRRIPGLLLMGIGGGLNFLAISANGGVMPASESALRAAGRAAVHDRFANSTAVEHPKLQFLGDVFALPSSWPLHNVFSVGDVLIVLGALVGAHVITRSRLVPTGRGELASLRHRPDFVRLWIAQAVSNLGDWIYALAVATTVAGRSDGARILAALLICQFGPSALVSALGGSLVDRLSRKRLMLGADLLRALAVVSLLVTGSPSAVHLCAVAAALGLFGGLFQPSLQASLPNVVASEQLVAANALMGATLNMAIMVGPILGGVMAASLGADVAFAVNAASFALSAALIAVVRLPRRSSAEPVAAAPVRDLVDGFRYIVTARVVRGVMVVVGIVIVAAAIKNPVEPLFILRTLGERPASLGLAGTIWGLGMVLGSTIAPAAARRWSRPSLLSVSIALVGVAILGASRATVLAPLLILWLIAGAGNALGTVAYETLLQEHTPDAYRGRVIAASEAVIDAAFLVGGAVAGALAGALGARGAFVVCGAVFLVAAGATRVLLGARRALAAPSEAPLAEVPSLGAAAGPGSVGPVHPTPITPSFALESFVHVRAGDWELVRLVGWWPAPVEGPAVLIVDDGVRVHRIPALPKLAADGPFLRAGFPVLPALVANRRSAFALEAPGGLVDLPRPAPREMPARRERELALAA